MSMMRDNIFYHYGEKWKRKTCNQFAVVVVVIVVVVVVVIVVVFVVVTVVVTCYLVFISLQTKRNKIIHNSRSRYNNNRWNQLIN